MESHAFHVKLHEKFVAKLYEQYFGEKFCFNFDLKLNRTFRCIWKICPPEKQIQPQID